MLHFSGKHHHIWQIVKEQKMLYVWCLTVWYSLQCCKLTCWFCAAALVVWDVCTLVISRWVCLTCDLFCQLLWDQTERRDEAPCWAPTVGLMKCCSVNCRKIHVHHIMWSHGWSSIICKQTQYFSVSGPAVDRWGCRPSAEVLRWRKSKPLTCLQDPSVSDSRDQDWHVASDVPRPVWMLWVLSYEIHCRLHFLQIFVIQVLFCIIFTGRKEGVELPHTSTRNIYEDI